MRRGGNVQRKMHGLFCDLTSPETELTNNATFENCKRKTKPSEFNYQQGTVGR